MQEEDRDQEYPLFKTPNGKTVEVKPDGVYGLWLINPHGVNLPTELKTSRYTSAEEASKDVLKWIQSIRDKQK